MFVFTNSNTVLPYKGNILSSSSAVNLTDDRGCRYTSSDSIKNSYACAIFALQNKHPTECGKDYWNDLLK